MIKPDKEYIDELIISFLSKGATPEELEYLLQWIETDSNNREYYQHMYMAWLQNASINQLPLEHEKRALQQTQRKILDINRKKPVRNAQKITLPRSIFKYAAAIAFILVIATYSITRYTINQQPDSQISEMIYEAHYGSRAYATLPDGSKVWLNSGSKLSVQSGYNLHERKVQLIGEAYFEVQTNPEKPFIVKAREISIRATGTTFNVKAYPEEEQITTTLVTGIVFIEGHDDKEKEFKIKMTPSQTICYNTKQSKIEEDVNVVTASTKTRQQNNTDKPLPSITVNQVKTEAITSWMKDRWII